MHAQTPPPPISFRSPPELLASAKLSAHRRGISLSEVIRDSLRETGATTPFIIRDATLDDVPELGTRVCK